MFSSAPRRLLLFRQEPVAALLLLPFCLLAAATTSTVSAKEYIVGDAAGWVIGPNYTRWASKKEFYVGDTLVFQYGRGDHNVVVVNKTQYDNCTSPPKALTLATGNDTVRLEEAGTQWYICGIPLHCQAEQRMAITVLEIPVAPSPAPSPQATSTRSGSTTAGICRKGSWRGLCSLLLLILYTVLG